jgi:ABC-type Fe3+/spermidine/putrescine transport system ATPase subunit
LGKDIDMIKIEELTILLGSFNLTDFYIEIEEKGFHFLLGPTGVGKTLILESIMGLHKPKKGKIWIGDREVQNLPPEQREISYVPQDLALFPHLKVKENILYGIGAKNLKVQAYEEYVQALIQVMKVGHLLERYPANLSGGEKKRVALLRALAPKPKLLLLDEPLSGLDPSIKFEIQQLLRTLHASFHPTILCVTHDFEDAYLLGERITIFIDGKVEQVGRREDIFLRPKSKRVAQFLGLRNLFSGRILRQEDPLQRLIIGVNGLQFSIPMTLYQDKIEVGKEIDLFIRPEEVMIIREGKPVKDSLRRNIFEGEILDIADKGRYHSVYFQTKEGKVLFEISIPNYTFRNLNLSTGKIVKVALREESLWMMS